MREEGGKPDYILLSAVLALIVLGIIILISVSSPLAQEKAGTPTFYLFRQTVVGLIPGFILGFLAFKISPFYLKKWSLILMIGVLFLMILVFVPGIGISVGGAKRWINLGLISFQPSEFLKLSFIIYLAAWLTSRIEEKGTFRLKKRVKKIPETLLAFLAVMGVISLLLIFQPDISTLGILIVCAALIYFSARTPLWHTLLITSTALAGLFALIKIAPYRLNRLLVFLHPEMDPMGMGYQIKQALIAVGSGGVVGTGLGMSIQKFGLLPQPMSDSIFAVFAEETGLIGGLILISLFLVFAWRGLEISKKASDKFSQLLSLGISVWISLQAFVNIGSMVGILPLTGIPLPFISYGGSALVAELIGVGILLNISRQIKD